MDPAIIGYMRIGSFRIGVKKPLWDEILEKTKKTPTKSMGGVDPCVIGHFRIGHMRIGCTLPLFDKLVEDLKKKG